MEEFPLFDVHLWFLLVQAAASLKPVSVGWAKNNGFPSLKASRFRVSCAVISPSSTLYIILTVFLLNDLKLILTSSKTEFNLFISIFFFLESFDLVLFSLVLLILTRCEINCNVHDLIGKARDRGESY